MTTKTDTGIKIETLINAPVEKVWNYWTNPFHIIHWNAASDDWHTPRAENDLRVGGSFSTRMESRDGNMGFDFNGVYNSVDPYKLLEYTIEDGREVRISFISSGDITKIIEVFEPEQTNSIELQQKGWQSILDNFKKYVEKPNSFHNLQFETLVYAQPEKVYNLMLDKKHYSEWTSVFNPNSHFEGSWEKGSKMIFKGIDENGNTGGMISRIKENIPGSYLSIEHIGILKNNEEIMNGPEVESWAGALENYTFKSSDENTLLIIDIDSNEEFSGYFKETWPKALNNLKHLCEQ